MKRLDELEPRTNLQATPAPAGVVADDVNFHFIITQSGSYYLSANLAVTKNSGIRIFAEDVTIDLNGFKISKASGPTGGVGIEIRPASHRASIRNGSIKGFARGINSVEGTPAESYARGCAFRDLVVSGCTNAGIFAGDRALLESCRAHDNSGTYGIFAGIGSVLTNCTASDNSGAASTSAGIGTADACTISHCTASFNTTTAAPSTPTTGMGFEVGDSGTIENCQAYHNRGDGINVRNYTVVRENSCVVNGNFGGDGADIHSTGTLNRIEGNHVLSAALRGIQVDGTRNLIIKNSAAGNTTSYVIAASNVFGAIVDRRFPGSPGVNGSSAPSSAGTTDPWANFSH